MHDKHEQ
jgi:hypothetical protein